MYNAHWFVDVQRKLAVKEEKSNGACAAAIPLSTSSPTSNTFDSLNPIAPNSVRQQLLRVEDVGLIPIRQPARQTKKTEAVVKSEFPNAAAPTSTDATGVRRRNVPEVIGLGMVPQAEPDEDDEHVDSSHPLARASKSSHESRDGDFPKLEKAIECSPQSHLGIMLPDVPMKDTAMAGFASPFQSSSSSVLGSLSQMQPPTSAKSMKCEDGLALSAVKHAVDFGGMSMPGDTRYSEHVKLESASDISYMDDDVASKGDDCLGTNRRDVHSSSPNAVKLEPMYD